MLGGVRYPFTRNWYFKYSNCTFHLLHRCSIVMLYFIVVQNVLFCIFLFYRMVSKIIMVTTTSITIMTIITSCLLKLMFSIELRFGDIGRVLSYYIDINIKINAYF